MRETGLPGPRLWHGLLLLRAAVPQRVLAMLSKHKRAAAVVLSEAALFPAEPGGVGGVRGERPRDGQEQRSSPLREPV